MTHEIIDGMERSPDGRWVSYSYAIERGRVIFVAFFDAYALSNTEYVFFGGQREGTKQSMV